MLDLSGTVINEYEFVKFLRSTNSTVTYAAKYIKAGDWYYIKYLSSRITKDLDFITCFKSETQNATQFKNTYVTPLVDYWRDSKGAYLVTPFKWNLPTKMKRLGRESLDLVTVRQILDQAADALDAIHSTGNVHGNIKLTELLMDDDWEQFYLRGDHWLSDFTLAREVKNPSGDVDKIASPQYMAPEMWEGHWTGKAIDIYSLGITLFEMVTLRRPFLGTTEQLKEAHQTEPIPPLERYRSENAIEDLYRVITKATAKDPANRYQSAKDMAQDFHEAVKISTGYLIRRVPPKVTGGLIDDQSVQEMQHTGLFIPKILRDKYFMQYSDLEAIGEGGMGEVYKGLHKEQQRYDAIKVLLRHLVGNEASQQRLLMEARALSNLRHPNIIKIHDSGIIGDNCYLVMEYIDGPNLEVHLKEEGRLHFSQAIPLVRGIASALEHTHQRRIIHRDVKPSNILLKPIPDKTNATGDPYYRPILSDFGLAKVLDASVMHTQTSQAMGTYAYMAPEQMDDARTVTNRADIYSLGVITYQLLTGELPFTGNNLASLIRTVLNNPVPDPREIVPDIPYTVVDALNIAMAKDPNNRFKSVADFLQALRL